MMNYLRTKLGMMLVGLLVLLVGTISAQDTIWPVITVTSIEGGVNIRQSPSADAQTIDILFLEDEGTAIARNGDWLYIETDEAPGWVANWVVTENDPILDFEDLLEVQIDDQGNPIFPEITITIMLQENNQEVFEDTTLVNFQEAYPDITIQWVNYTPDGISDQVAQLITEGGEVPNIGVTSYYSISRLIELEGLTDLTPLLEPYLDDINPSYLEYCTSEGRIYCVPWDMSPAVMYYRRDVFEAAGLPSDPESVNELVATWDMYLDTCITIKEETDLDCFALPKANHDGDLFFTILWSRGLDILGEDEIIIDSPEAVETLEMLGQFWDADVVLDAPIWSAEWYGGLGATIDATKPQPVATIIVPAWIGAFLKLWISPDHAGDWGVALIPAWEENGVRAVDLGGSTFFIPEDSDNKEAAWAFIEYMILNPEVHAEHFAYSSYFPAITSVLDEPIFDEADPFFGGQNVNSLYIDIAEKAPIPAINSEFANSMYPLALEAIENYASGAMTAEEALTAAGDAIRLELNLP